MSTRSSAARYARALFDVASKEADPAAAERELTAFVTLVEQHTELQRIFANPVIPAPAKRAVVQEVLGRLHISGPTAKLLLLLASRGRVELVPEVLAAYRERLMEHRKVVQAEITTAAPLTPEQVAQLQRRLAEITGRTVNMTAKVDDSIIGGLVTRIGSTVYDGSVATQLARVRDTLVERNRA